MKSYRRSLSSPSSFVPEPCRPLGLLVAIVCIVTASGASAAAANLENLGLFEQSLEDLLKVKVTSVTKKSEERVNAASAIHVITAEDIRRRGATTVTDALRGVPGVHVGQVGGGSWAISIRGFQSQYASHLLVMIDGRTVFSPMFSGVYWDAQDVFLADVERIEIIRGPGATVWGANAVNGVINIITKSARDTQGAYVEGSGGNQQQGGAGRYGGRIGAHTYYRVYGKYDSFDSTFAGSGARNFDGHQNFRTGFRLDSYPTDQDTYTLQGDYHHGEINNIATLATSGGGSTSLSEVLRAHGVNLLGSWKREFSPTVDQELRGYYDFVQRDEATFLQNAHTADLDYRLRWAVTDSNELTVGGGYRVVWYDSGNTLTYALNPAHGDIQTYNVFAQDTIRLSEKVRLTLGSKFEQAEHFKLKPLPSARLLWQASDQHTFWSAASRSMRTPGQAYHLTALIPGGSGLTLNPDSNPRHTLATIYELGHRMQPAKDWQFDTALFYSKYSGITDMRYAYPSLTLENTASAQSYGVEVSATWQATESWRLQSSYSFLKMDASRAAGLGTEEVLAVGANPMHQASLHSLWSLSPQWDLDFSANYVDAPEAWTLVESYVRLDARLAWRPRKNLEFSLGVQNLLDNRHAEAQALGVTGSVMEARQIPRAFYGRFSYQF